LRTRYALRDRFLRVIRDAARMCESRRLWQDAANLYQSALQLDTLNEDLYRGLMVCHQELGDHSEALQAYWRCRELLTRFLGVPPNAKTEALYHSVRERASAAATRECADRLSRYGRDRDASCGECAVSR
jgi:two-component SAPR family response regulator